jgi:hypothetical protein
MAQINDVIDIRTGGRICPCAATVLAIDGGGNPTSVRRNADNIVLSNNEFAIWTGPMPVINRRGASPAAQKAFNH